jgi:transcriptional regulator with XRE-family HTH domain
MLYIHVKLYSAWKEKGVFAIDKSVRTKYLEFLAETGITRYEFSKRSGIPESTLWSLAKKEDYDVRESNIRKIAQGMGVPPSELFVAEDNAVCLNENSEVRLVKNFRGLSERQKGCVEGYIQALIDESKTP